MARKGNPISVRLDLNRSSDSSWFSISECGTGRIFYLEILTVLLIHGLIFLVYRALGITSACIMVIGIIRECVTFLSIFIPQSRLRRIVFAISISLGFGLQMLILEQFSVGIIFLLMILFLLLLVVREFFLSKDKSFILEVIFYLILLSPHFFVDLRWSFNFIFMLFCLSLVKSFFNRINMDFSCSLKSLNFTLFWLIVYLFFHCNFPFKETYFYIQMLFLIAGSLVIYFCFLSERGSELTITAFAYLSLNIYIARLITDNDTAFERCTVVYISTLLVICLFLWSLSIKRKESLSNIFNENKVKIWITLLVFLDPILSSLYGEVNAQYTWVADWFYFFKLEVGVLGLIYFYFNEEQKSSIRYIVIKGNSRFRNTSQREKERKRVMHRIKNKLVFRRTKIGWINRQVINYLMRCVTK